LTCTVAIHQPNFFPWLGYFDKIRRADVFILIDDVQFQKTGGSWSNRVKVLINGEGRWLTAPVDRNFHGTRKVNEMVFSDKEDWRSRVLKTLVTSYKRAPYFEETYFIIEPLIRNPETNVAEYNIHAIKALASGLGYPLDSLIRASDLATNSSATERLIELTKRVGGDCYLCGGGASGYQEDGVFSAAEVELRYQCFAHPTYTQQYGREFVSGLSIVDVLMNLGFEGARRLLRRDV
jgi:hypothetical protein